jgi:PKD repeat protein
MRVSRWAVFSVLLLVAIAPTSAFATEYFVATNGNDSNPGTITQPFLTIDHATQLAVAGDIVSVRAGTYNEDARFYADGSSSAWITLRSYDGDLAATIGDGINILDRSYIRIIGFVSYSSGAMPIHIQPGADYVTTRSQYIDVLRCKFCAPARYDTVKINQSDYILMEDCEITGVAGDEAVDTVWMNYGIFRRCFIHDYDDIGVTFKGGAHYPILEDSVVVHALVDGAKATRFGGSTDAQYRDPDSTYASEYGVMRNNIIKDCRAPACGDYECWYAYFYNNTVVDCGSSLGIFVHHADPKYSGDGGSRHVYWINNVVLDNAGDMIEVYHDQSSLPIEDWYGDYNNYYNNGNPIPSGAWTGHDPNLEVHSTFGNPNLANRTGSATTYAGWKDCFRITSASTLLIDRGTSYAGTDPQPAVHHDIDGVARPQGAGWDIGAFEYGSGGGQPPVANFSGNPTSGTAPLVVAFTDLSTNSPTSWSWTFGDGGTSTAQNPSHTYAAGTYTVSLTATNAYGSDGETKNNYITASSGGQPPVANFTGNPTSGTAPLAVAFTDTSTNSPTSWSWTFGDGGTSTAQNPSHTYAAGQYTVSLTATNAYGSDSETKTNYITATSGGGGDYFCTSIVVTGTILSGNHTSVHASDNSYLAVESRKLSGKQTSTVAYTFETGLSSLSSLTVTVELHPSLAPQTQKIRMWNYTTSAWVEVDSRSITTTSDTTTVLNVPSPAAYRSATGQVQVLVRTGDVGGTVWTCYTDYMKITAAP